MLGVEQVLWLLLPALSNALVTRSVRPTIVHNEDVQVQAGINTTNATAAVFPPGAWLGFGLNMLGLNTVDADTVFSCHHESDRRLTRVRWATAC